MSTDAVKRIDEAREVLRETVQRLAEIADGLRGEPELPSEPMTDGTVVIAMPADEDLIPTVWLRSDSGFGRDWYLGGEGGAISWREVCSHGTPVLLVRADQTVVLPSEFPAEPVVEWAPSGTSLSALVLSEFDRLRVTARARHTGDGEFASALIPLADAERWLLETLALVRSKGGGSS
jgi:hypothetical protein